MTAWIRQSVIGKVQPSQAQADTRVRRPLLTQELEVG